MNNVLKNFHISRKCCTFVRNIDNSVHAIYPQNVLHSQVKPSIDRVYSWEDNVFHVKTTINNVTNYYKTDAPFYIVRPMIMQDIAIQHLRCELNTELIFLVIQDKIVKLHMSKLLPELLFSHETLEQEAWIMHNFQNIVNKNFDVLRKDVVEGCRLILNSYNAGGI